MFAQQCDLDAGRVGVDRRRLSPVPQSPGAGRRAARAHALAAAAAAHQAPAAEHFQLCIRGFRIRELSTSRGDQSAGGGLTARPAAASAQPPRRGAQPRQGRRKRAARPRAHQGAQVSGAWSGRVRPDAASPRARASSSTSASASRTPTPTGATMIKDTERQPHLPVHRRRAHGHRCGRRRQRGALHQSRLRSELRVGDRGSSRVHRCASATIQPGEELSYDYQIRRERDDPANVDVIFACRCGAASCRGTMLWPAKRPEVRRKKKAAARVAQGVRQRRSK